MHMQFVRVAVICIALLVAARPTSAFAHGEHHGTVETLVQTIGGHSFTIAITHAATIRTPVIIEFTPHTQLDDATIMVQAAPAEVPSRRTLPVVAQDVPETPGRYHAELMLDQPGEWMLEVRMVGAQGGTAMIPVTISPLMSTSALTISIIVGVGSLLMLVMIAGVVMRGRRSTAYDKLSGPLIQHG